MKKILCYAIIFLCLANAIPVQAKEKKEVVKLSIWSISTEETDLLQSVLSKFEKKYPNITVELVLESNQETFPYVIAEEMKRKLGPDVYAVHSFEVDYYLNEGVMEDLASYLSKSKTIKKENYFPVLYDMFVSSDKTYAIPKGFTTFCLFYNEKMFKEAKIDPPKTVNDFQEAAAKLTNKKGRFGFGLDEDFAPFLLGLLTLNDNVIENNKVNFTNETFMGALEKINTMLTLDRSITNPTSIGYDTVWESFANEGIAMMIEGMYVIPYLRSEAQGISWKAIDIPVYKGQELGLLDTVAYAMNTNSKHKDAAWKLIEYLAGEEGMAEWTSNELEMPTLKSVYKSQKWESKEKYKAFIKDFKTLQSFTNNKYSPIIRTRFNQAFQNYYYGQSDYESAFKEGAKRAEHYIKVMEKNKNQ